MFVNRYVSSSRSRLIPLSTSLSFVRCFRPFNSVDTTALPRSAADFPSRTDVVDTDHTDRLHDSSSHWNRQQTRSQEPDWLPYQPAPEPSTLLFNETGVWDAKQIAMEKKRKLDRAKQLERANKRRDRRLASKDVFLPEGNSQEVLDHEVRLLLERVQPSSEHSDQTSSRDKEFGSETRLPAEPAELNQEVELDIFQLSSTGDGLAYNAAKDHVFVIPFSVPGDRVLAKPWQWKGAYTHCDNLKLVQASSAREGVEPQCKHFGKCSGCQFQMLPYEAQLEHKRDVVKRAYSLFSGVRPAQIPEPLSTFGSPLQYGYRTKLTPHFDTPKAFVKVDHWEKVPPIGFMDKTTKTVLDIEECPIGTEIVQEGLKHQRRHIADTIQDYRLGATLLIRESTRRTLPDSGTDVAGQKNQSFPSDPTSLALLSKETIVQGPHNTKFRYKYEPFTDTKSYVSTSNDTASEYITTTINADTSPPTTKTYKFTNSAGSFFQNNNSILGPFTSYIYGLCKASNDPASSTPKIKYLLDAYSGSGLFALTLSPLFSSSLGIDIDSKSIATARENAKFNDVNNTGFIDADAAALFADVPYPADETLIVIDPPRKGCDRNFLNQLRRFAPARVIYISCNVHTQARDVGILVNGFKGRDLDWEGPGLAKYEIEVLRGFDFFPQTSHVEGVCVLKRVSETK